MLSTLYEHGRSLHAVAGSVEEQSKMLEGGGAGQRADATRDARLAAMSEGVNAIVSKYAVEPAEAAAEGGDGEVQAPESDAVA